MANAAHLRRISRSVLAVARQMEVTDSLVANLGRLEKLFREVRALRHFMVTRHIATEEKLKVLKKVFGDQVTPLEYEVLRLLLDEQMGAYLPELSRAIARLAAADEGLAGLTVTSAEPLSEGDLSAYGKRLEEALGRPVQVTGQTDPALLGGIKLRFGNTLVDGSIARRLELMRAELA